MKKVLMYNLLVSALVLTNLGVFSQTSENFNSRAGAALNEVKPFLQDHCWQFYDFDINRNGWTPGIEGDGAMVSGPSSSSTQNTGIYTPVLEVAGDIQISFKYKFSSDVTSNRWFKIYLTDGNNQIVKLLDNVNVTGKNANTTYTYNKVLPGGSSFYKIYINFQGEGGSTRIAIDDLSLSPRLLYADGCNKTPVAVNDAVGGTPARTASGKVTPNDYDPNGDQFYAQLITDSPDGTVTLLSDGNFTFTPNAGFTGNSTSFTYNICDYGTPQMCSETATVTITFAENASLPVSIIDLKAAFDDGNKVMVSWTTTFESNNDHFDIERSTDGITYEVVGSVKGAGTSGVSHKYSFADNIKSINTNKKDIYYRVRQVDLDKRTAVTKILIVRVYKSKTVQMISVTPNPVINNIRVNMDLNESSMIVIKVVANSGAEIMRKTVKAGSGSNSFELEGTSKLQPGVYFMEVIVNSNERMMVKLIKN